MTDFTNYFHLKAKFNYTMTIKQMVKTNGVTM